MLAAHTRVQLLRTAVKHDNVRLAALTGYARGGSGGGGGSIGIQILQHCSPCDFSVS